MGDHDAAQAGFSLVELLLAIAILGVATVGILGGLGTAIGASATTRAQTTAEAAVRSNGEAVLRATYVPCAADYATVVTAPPGFSVTTAVVAVAAGDDGSGRRVVGTSSAPCATASLQRVTLRVRSTDGRVERSLEVLKRRPT